MTYCAQDDILEQVQENVLINLTDDNDAGVVDSTIIARAIEDAGAMIDAYCQRRYTVPLSPVPPMIRRLAVDLAIYNLYSRRDLMPPKVREDRQQAAVRFLEKASAGQIDLGAATPAREQSSHGVDITSPSRIFSRETMEGF